MEHVICPECQAKISNEMKVCSNCGYPLKTDTSEMNKSINKVEVREKKEVLKENIFKLQGKESILNKVIAVLMLIIAFSNVRYIFTCAFGCFDNIMYYGIFDFYTILYFIYTIESAMTVAGFGITGILFLLGKRKEYLTLSTLVICGSYAALTFENLLLCFDWFNIYRLVFLTTTIGTMFIWGMSVFFNKLEYKNKPNQIKKILLCMTGVLCIIDLWAIITGVYYSDVKTIIINLIEYVVLAMFVWIQSNKNEINSKQEKGEYIMDSIQMNNNQQQVHTSIESVNGYVKIVNLIVFSILTLGIYSYIWIYRTVGLFNEKRIGEERSQGVQVVLCLFVPFYMIYWLYKQSKLTEEYTLRVGGRSNDLSVISLVLSIFGLSLVAVALIQDQMNKNLMLEYGYTSKQEVYTEPIRTESYSRVVVANTSQTKVNQEVVYNEPAFDRISDTDIEYLKKLKELNDMGILSDEEYKAKKENVLG